MPNPLFFNTLTPNTSLRLVVGLGNPGIKYRDTWHNLGARTVEELIRRLELTPKSERRGYVGAEWHRGDQRTMLMIPMAFMNCSGGVVAGWIYYFGVHPGQALVICDDHDLPLGVIRLRTSGSSGGHKGLKDIISRIGTENIPRLRIGFKTDNERPDLSHQVLSSIPKDLETIADQVISTAADAVEMIFQDGFEAAMNRYNGMKITEEI